MSDDKTHLGSWRIRPGQTAAGVMVDSAQRYELTEAGWDALLGLSDEYVKHCRRINTKSHELIEEADL